MDLKVTVQAGSDVIIRKQEYLLTVVPYDLGIRAIKSNIITAKGQLLVGLGEGVAGVIPPGEDGQMLTPDSTPENPLGYIWVTAGGQSVSSLTNGAGIELNNGDVVVFKSGEDRTVTTTTTEKDLGIAGVVQDAIAVGEVGPVATFAGHIVQVNCDSVAVSKGDYLIASTTAKYATPTKTKTPACFAKALTAKGTGTGQVWAMLLAYEPVLSYPPLGNLLSWYMPESLSGYSEGGAITSWADSGPASKAFNITGGNCPVARHNIVNGLSALQFDNYDDYMARASSWPNGGAVRTFAIVAKPTVTTATYILSMGSPTTSLSLACNKGTQDGLLMAMNNTYGGVTDSNNTIRIYIVTYDGSLLTCHKNGGTLTASATLTLNTDTSYNWIGRYSSTHFFGGYIFELVGYNIALSSIERASVFSYLAARYNVTLT